MSDLAKGQGREGADGAAGYGATTRVIHWVTAIVMATLVALGLYARLFPPDSPPRVVIFFFHKSLGLFVLVVTLARLAWLKLSPARPDTSRLQAWEILASRLGQGLMYALLISMPLSGMMMVQGSGREVGFFNLFTLPQLAPMEPGVADRSQRYYLLGKFLHDDVFQWGLYFAFALHMAGVVKHRFIDGDRTFICRMWGRPPA